ncbi:hypothetical protein NR798_27405 [Archangium gephyra]|uniref:hypothetical protein n=1 Tax=Archangium gephyra TaxID=48 RepID=UPI0035D518DB
MSLRIIPCCVLVAGIAFLGSACSPTADASTQTAALAQGGEFCGGIAGIPCDEGFTCVDDPNDDCDPNQGGRDCGGICQEQGAEKKNCTGKEPGYTYVSRDPAQCPAILFTCPEGQSAFFNDCGCGCFTNACNYDDPSRTYVSQDPDQCAVIRFTCPEGQSAFFDSCGCGCTTAP